MTFAVWLMVHSCSSELLSPRKRWSLRSSFGDVDDGFGKRLRSFLRQVVPNAAFDQPVRILAREFLGVGAGLRMRRAVGVAFHGDGRHGDDREFGKPLFQGVELRLAFRETKPPTVVVNRDGDMIGIVES